MAERDDPTAEPPNPRRAPLLRGALLGALLGAAFGVVEMTVRIGGRMEPSVARRVGGLLLFAGILYGLAGLLLGALAGWAARRAPDRTRAFAAAVGGVLFVAALLPVGERFWEATPTRRVAAFVGCLAAAAIVARVLARFLPQRFPPRWVRPRYLALAGAAAVVLGGAAALTLAAGEDVEPFAGPRGTAPAQAPNVVFVVVDTLRPDVLGAYGDAGGLTPNEDALARSGAVFEEVLAPSSWTLPSVTSLLTSREPWRHGVVDFNSLLSSDVDSLPKALGRAGYDRRAIVGNGLLSVRRGFNQGFELFDVYSFDLESHLFLSKALTRALRLSGLLAFSGRAMNPVPAIDRSRFPWLTTRLSFDIHDDLLTDRALAATRDWQAHGEAPLFLYVHYGAPHSPYTKHPQGLLPDSPELTVSNRDELWQRYRAEAAWTDAQVGRLFEGLRAQGVLDGAVLVFTADHGEEFLEHDGWEHGHGLYQEVLRVPWLVAAPGIAPGTRIAGQVRLLDVAPTVIGLAGLEPVPGFDGTDRSALLRGDEQGVDEASVFAELTSRPLNPEVNWFGVRHGRWKVIRQRDLQGALLEQQVFDLAADPEERAPLAAAPPELDDLLESLDAYESLQSTAAGGELTEDQLEHMRALGYTDDK